MHCTAAQNMTHQWFIVSCISKLGNGKRTVGATTLSHVDVFIQILMWSGVFMVIPEGTNTSMLAMHTFIF